MDDSDEAIARDVATIGRIGAVPSMLRVICKKAGLGFARPASSQPGGGLGLGLYICSQIVKAHGGRLSVSSSAETGTCFVARIPAGGAA